VAQQAAIYEGTPGKRYEFYSLATDTAGNREAPPLYADAQTVVGLSNNAPTLTLNAPAEINEGQTLVITATATDPQMPAQSLLFTLLSGPPGAVLNPSTGRIEWLTGEGNGPGTNLFRVSARDNGLPPLSATSQVSVIVREINSAPVILNAPTRTTREGLLLVVTNPAFDGDLPVQSLTWSLGAGAPAGATIEAATGIFRWRPSSTPGRHHQRPAIDRARQRLARPQRHAKLERHRARYAGRLPPVAGTHQCVQGRNFLRAAAPEQRHRTVGSPFHD